MRKIVILLLSVLSLNHAYAACDNDLDIKLAKTLKYADALKSEKSYFTACKVWPADPKKTIVALSFIQPSESADPNGSDDGDYDLNVLVVETETNKILSHIYQKNAFVSDAIRLTGIDIDTARYNLNDDVRAFGVTSSYMGASSVNPFSETNMTLFVENKKHLKPVLKNLPVSSSRGEWDGNCVGEGSSMKRVFDLDKTLSAGYRDLIVRQTTEEYSTNLNKARECVNHKSPPSKKNYRLKFDGQTYILPAALKEAW